MDKSFGQVARPAGRGPGSQQTRERLLRAAAELIAEVGWGAVRTRAVAERADLPHGAVSYHFHGKDELLTEAALDTFSRAFPIAELESLETIPDLVTLIEGWFNTAETADPVVAGVGIEAMLHAERDPALRQGMAELMDRYREALSRIVRDNQRRKAIIKGVDARGLATLLGAVGDGLFLHARIDPALDIRAALVTLRKLLLR